MPDPTPAFSIGQIITVALGSGVVSACVGQSLTAFFASRGYKKEATYTALRAALALDQFVADAAEMLSNWKGIDAFEVQREQHEDVDVERAHFPAFDGFDERLDWRHVDAALAAKVLNFPVEVRATSKSISGAFEFDDDYGLDQMQWHGALKAERAISLTKELRSKYHLPTPDPEQLPWDAKAFALERLAEIKTERARKAAMPDPLEEVAPASAAGS